MVTYFNEVFKIKKEEVKKKRLQILYKTTVGTIEMHQIQCPTCKTKGSFIRWGTYSRMVIGYGYEETINIQRLYCKNCLGTHAILLAFMVPYSRFIIDIHIAIAQAKNDDELFSICAAIGGEHYDWGRYNKRQYRKYWKERLRAHKIAFDEKIVFRVFEKYARQYMQIRATINTLIH